MNYASYPELIEFYTGIDRRRDNALEILIEDMKATRKIVKEKCGLPDDFNVFNSAKWTPSGDQIELMHEEVASGALSSNLPEEVKDQYADQGYDRARPLTQSIHKILENYSLLRLMRSTEASCRALRNSDYSSPVVRHALLKEILSSWDQIIKVLIVLSPMMAKQGYAVLEGASFILTDEIEGSQEDKFFWILQVLPLNVVNWYRDDLFSTKMGPLLYKYQRNESDELIKHMLNLLLINKRPKGWCSHIENYIYSENKNSYYLRDIYQNLRAEYQFSFASNDELMSLKKLINMTAAKHDYGIEKPGAKALRQKTREDILPKRDVDID